MARRKRSKFHYPIFSCFLLVNCDCDVLRWLATAYRCWRDLIGDWHKPRPSRPTLCVMLATDEDAKMQVSLDFY